MQDDRVHYAGQPVAVVVADTLENATYAASLVRIDYTTQQQHHHPMGTMATTVRWAADETAEQRG